MGRLAGLPALAAGVWRQYRRVWSGASGLGRSEGPVIATADGRFASPNAGSRRPSNLEQVSRFVNDIRQAVEQGRLSVRFGPGDVRRACPGWADHTYGVFLPKHRSGNPGGYTAYFKRHPDGTYSLL